MQMHLIIAVLFIITVVMAFIEDYIEEFYKVVILAGYAFFMILLATTKSIEHTADALGYEDMFLHNDDTLVEIATEPTYIYLSRLLLLFGGSVVAIFFIYAIIAIPAKLKAIYAMTPYVFTALLIYIPVYFELHDMIQIRAAAAAAFLLSSLIPLSKKHYWQATLLMIGGILFHYSAVVYLPFLLFGNRKLNVMWRFVVAGLVPASLVMYFMKKDLLSMIPSSLLGGKIDYYKASAEAGDWADIPLPYKNLYLMTKCIILYLCLYYYDLIVKRNPFAPLLINLFAASIIFLLTMATIPVLAGRISDLYGIVDCIVFTFCLYLVSPALIVRIAIAVVGLYMIVYNMLTTEYFT